MWLGLSVASWAAAQDIDASIDLRAVDSDATQSRLTGGLGTTRFAAADKGVQIGELRIGYRADLAEPQTHALPLLVPQVDADGNELSGIRLPNVAVPLATYTGWNFRSPTIGQPGELLPLTGSFIPFPVTKAAQEAAHDPRPSIEERYESRERYQVLVTDAAAKLVQQRYLLNQDVPAVVERALATWDEITGGALSAGK